MKYIARLLLKNSPAGLNGSSSKQNQIKKVNLKQKKRRKERTKERNDKWSIDELIMMMTILKREKKGRGSLKYETEMSKPLIDPFESKTSDISNNNSSTY